MRGGDGGLWGTAPQPAPAWRVVPIVLLVFVFPLIQGMIVPGLSRVADDLEVTLESAAWLLSANLVSSALMTPVLGRMGDIFGRKRMLLTSLLVMGAGGALGAASSSFAGVLVGRILQGAGAGVFPLLTGIIRVVASPGARPRLVGVMAAATAVGAVIGIPVGAVVIDVSSYRMLFVLMAVMSLLAVIGAFVLVPDVEQGEPTNIDLLGLTLLGVGMSLVLLAVGGVSDHGWLGRQTLVTMGLGVSALCGLYVVETRVAGPLIDVRTLLLPRIALINTASVATGGVLYVGMVVVPQLAQQTEGPGPGLGMSATRAGLLLVPGSVLMIAAGWLAGILSRFWREDVVYGLGALLSLVGMTTMAVQHADERWLVLGVSVLLAGCGMTFASLSNLIIGAVPHTATSEATGFNGLFRIAGAALGIQIAASLLASSSESPEPTSSGYALVFLVFALWSAFSIVLVALLRSISDTSAA